MASGVDGRALAELEHTVLLRPEADSPLRVPASRAWAYRLAGDTQLDALLIGQPVGAIIQQLPTSFRLPDYDKVNPFSSGKSRTWLFPHALAAGDAARRSLSHRLFYADVQHLANGGWLVPIGQEDALRPWLQTYQQFPPTVMRDLAPTGISPTLKVRRGEHAGKTYLQFVNDASWSENVIVQLKCPADTLVTSFGGLADGDTETSRSASRSIGAGWPVRQSSDSHSGLWTSRRLHSFQSCRVARNNFFCAKRSGGADGKSIEPIAEVD